MLCNLPLRADYRPFVPSHRFAGGHKLRNLSRSVKSVTSEERRSWRENRYFFYIEHFYIINILIHLIFIVGVTPT